MIIKSRRGSSTSLTTEKPCLKVSFDGCSDGTTLAYDLLWGGMQSRRSTENFLMCK